ncbi:hypothetical protein ACJMK2_015265 [Sinanodonta woodiana]|uniref:GAIN-B domain-containing protein n=1 Tax=Sinanodonta woodiana TaxID=1069815 RepID=A0ABD3V345_SINWO
MLQLSPCIIRSAQEISSASNRIIRAVDDMSNNVSLHGQVNIKIIQPSLAVEIWEQARPNVTGLEFIQLNKTSIGNSSLNTLNTAPTNINRVDAAIYIDPKVLQDSTSRLAMHVYYENKMFDDTTGRYETISRVVAARLSKNGKPIANLEDGTVTAIFMPFKEYTDVVCGHWNYTKNENAGGWSTEGCVHSVDAGRHICTCNHLTNFAILIVNVAYRLIVVPKLYHMFMVVPNLYHIIMGVPELYHTIMVVPELYHMFIVVPELYHTIMVVPELYHIIMVVPEL